MNLSAARSAKQQYRAAVDAQIIARGIEEPPRIAFGIAHGSGSNDFKVAVRARSLADIPPEIAKLADADQIDVQLTGPIEAKPSEVKALAVARHVGIGASVAHFRSSAGTLGFFAERISNGAIGFVSNNHVIALQDHGRAGDEILHPAPADAGRRMHDAIGFLEDGYPKLRRQRVAVDGAFARLAPGISFDPRPLGKKLQSPQNIGAALERDVCKIGRTTGMTTGRITAFEFEPFYVDYTFGSVRVENQIEIESSSENRFSAPGDSGSLIFTAGSQHPIGLLFASSAAGGKFGSGLSYANPISAVLETLGVTLIT